MRYKMFNVYMLEVEDTISNYLMSHIVNSLLLTARCGYYSSIAVLGSLQLADTKFTKWKWCEWKECGKIPKFQRYN